MVVKKELFKALKEHYYKNYFGKSTHAQFDISTCYDVFMNDTYAVEMLDDYFEDTRKSKLAQTLNTLRDNHQSKIKDYISKFGQVQEIMDIFRTTNYDAFLVGGSVRDAILGNFPKDFDFVTDMPYDDLEKLFETHGFKVQSEGKHFLVLIVSKNNIQYEIACFRKDGTYIDGRRPESVDIGDIYSDSDRRDFTINALYFDVKSCKLVDPTGKGILDIKDKVLRFVGKPKDRLEEDALRGWRFLRFLDKLEFTPEKKSLKAVKANFDDIYKRSNPQRVLQELSKFIKEL